MPTGIRSLVSDPATSQAQVANTIIGYDSYDHVRKSGIICLTIAALISLCAMLYSVVVRIPRRLILRKTQLLPFIVSLSLASMLENIGMLINLRWVTLGGVRQGPVCDLQAIVLQLGSLASAFSTCMIAIYLFGLVFFQFASNRRISAVLLVLGWLFIALFATIGPTAIRTPTKGPYMGVSDAWCSIRKEYRNEGIFLDIFWGVLAASINLFLCILIALHCHGYQVMFRGRLRAKTTPQDHGSNDRLADTSIVQISWILLWIPILYAILLFPFAIVRLSRYSGRQVPFGAVTFVTILYNLSGLGNVIVLILLHIRMSHIAKLPQFNLRNAEHKRISLLREESFSNPFLYRHIDPMAQQDKYHQYKGPNQDAFFIALPQPVVVKTNVAFEKRRSDYYRSPDDYRSPNDTMGNHLC